MEDKGGLTKSFHPAVRSLDKKRGQSFPLLPVSAGDFLAWTRTSHLICSLTTTTGGGSPAPVPREFPEKQGCQQRLGQAGGELGWLSLWPFNSSPADWTRSYFALVFIWVSLHLRIFFPPHLEHIQIVLLFVLGFSELKSSHCTWLTFLECSSSVWDRLSAPVLWGDTLGKVF